MTILVLYCNSVVGQQLRVDLSDGADEVDPSLNPIKGSGGALLREKIVAQATKRQVVVGDHRKRSFRIGAHWPLPVEVLEFGWRSQLRFLERLGADGRAAKGR